MSMDSKNELKRGSQKEPIGSSEFDAQIRQDEGFIQTTILINLMPLDKSVLNDLYDI
jgi:hypothetical protein